MAGLEQLEGSNGERQGGHKKAGTAAADNKIGLSQGPRMTTSFKAYNNMRSPTVL